ncbi:MAG TPA: response regulator transcription factor [Baekduia sp.]|jgi:DNA-binding NarL/FixJ family response regulator
MEALAAIDPTRTALLLGEREREPVDGAIAAALDGAGFATATLGAEATTAALGVLRAGGPAAARIAAIASSALLHPGLPLVALMPGDATGAQLRKAVQAGASGIVGDDDVASRLGPTALAVAAGQLAVPMALARRLTRRPLSHREKEIMGLVVQGYTNRQIAAELVLAESTIKTHLSSALRKLDVRSRAEAAALLLDPDEGVGLTVLSVVRAPRKIEMGATVG